jgi:hypothetical protein
MKIRVGFSTTNIKVLNGAKITQLPYGVFTPELLRQWCDHYHKELGWIKESFHG